MEMEKDLGYQDIVLLAHRLQERGNAFCAEADKSQAEGLSSYLSAQANSLEQARFAYESNLNDFLAIAKECIATADKKASLRLLEAYGKFGVKED